MATALLASFIFKPGGPLHVTYEESGDGTSIHFSPKSFTIHAALRVSENLEMCSEI